MQARYFPHIDFLNAKLRTNPNYVWRSVMEAQDIVKMGCKRQICDGSSTTVWKIL